MNRTDFQGMCELLDDGQMIWVENMQSHNKGRVVGCKQDGLEVEVDNHCEIWRSSDCSEITHGYRVNYQEVMKHPHEYDSHLD